MVPLPGVRSLLHCTLVRVLANFNVLTDVKETMRLVVLCLIAWVVLAVAALASGGTSDNHGSRGTHGLVAR